MYNVMFVNNNGELTVSHICNENEVKFWIAEGYYVRKH